MFTVATHRTDLLATCLPIYPRTPIHLREWTRISRVKADDVMMALSYGHKPSVGLADMRCIRDMTDNHAVFDIEFNEQIDGETIVKKFPVSQYAYASAYCHYLEGRQ